MKNIETTLALAVGRRATSGNALTVQDLITYLNGDDAMVYQSWELASVDDAIAPSPDQCYGEPGADQWDIEAPGAPCFTVPASLDGPAFFLWEQTARRVFAAFVKETGLAECVELSGLDFKEEADDELREAVAEQTQKDHRRIEALEEALGDALSYMELSEDEDVQKRHESGISVLEASSQP